MEKFDFGKNKIVGLILDLSIRHHNGIRVIDTVKDSLKKRIVNGNEELFFFVSDLSNKIPKSCGESTQQIDSYEEDIKFNYGLAVKYIVESFENSPEDIEKYFLTITDRFDKKFKGHYKSIFDLIRIKKIDLKVICLGIGCHYDRDFLQNEFSANGGLFLHIEDLNKMDEHLISCGV